MNLIVDIGNSSAKAAVFNENEMLMRKRLGADLINDLATIVSEYGVSVCALSSVGNTSDETVNAIKRLVPNTLYVKGDTPTPLICDYRSPQTLGSDRLAAAVGAAHCNPHCDLLIIDAGTCITYDYVSADGHYLGGNISPGLGMRLRALHEQTARLPFVTISNAEVQTYGYDTPSAIQNGVLRGMDYEIIGYLHAMLRQHPTARIFLTGGNGYRFAQEFEVERNDALVEIGLNCILQYQEK